MPRAVGREPVSGIGASAGVAGQWPVTAGVHLKINVRGPITLFRDAIRPQTLILWLSAT
jgi:hypothetical protein